MTPVACRVPPAADAVLEELAVKYKVRKSMVLRAALAVAMSDPGKIDRKLRDYVGLGI